MKSIKYAFFSGCKIPFYLPIYGLSSKAVLSAFGVESVDLEFNCCGYPMRNQNTEASVLAAARNLALAEKNKLNIVTPCKCCFGNLKHAEHLLKENRELRDAVNSILAKEDMKWKGEIEIKHILSVLYHDVGIEAIKKRVKSPCKDLKVAASYGCHALRPSNVTQFDHPFAPTIFEKLIEATGATTIEWSRRLECCGNPLWEKNSELSVKLMTSKLNDATVSGAHIICTACTYCQIQFDNVKKIAMPETLPSSKMKSILYTQLLGLAIGMDSKELGFD